MIHTLTSLWIFLAFMAFLMATQWFASVPITLSITLALSLFSYYYLEKPANRWVKRILTK